MIRNSQHPSEPGQRQQSNGLRLFVRSVAVWLMVMGAEIAHGILRTLFLVPIVGEFRSNQLGVFSGSVIIVVIACLTVRWIGATTTSGLLMTGAIWLVLTVAFEFLFGRFVAGLTWDQLLAGYDVLHGGMMPIGLVILFFSPMIAAKRFRRQ